MKSKPYEITTVVEFLNLSFSGELYYTGDEILHGLQEERK